VKLLLCLRFPRPCCRAVAFAQTLPASAIPPLDETWSKVFAAATTDELVDFDLLPIFPERARKLSFSLSRLLPDRLLAGRPRRAHLI
jgi:hypothetical protein